MTLGGRRVAVQRPRARTVDGSGEVGLETYRHFAYRDALTRVVLEQMLAGVSCRRLSRTLTGLAVPSANSICTESMPSLAMPATRMPVSECQNTLTETPFCAMTSALGQAISPGPIRQTPLAVVSWRNPAPRGRTDPLGLRAVGDTVGEQR